MRSILLYLSLGCAVLALALYLASLLPGIDR